ncbi:DUF5753 domain-containing protein [Streptomyces sp. NPDC059679]|uniref:DUF5753 domain-containing protein n=1 Tax=Streptomyces sp. NPDC059679 TaxID=3346903 RepID=UPI0036CA55DB
MVEQLIELNRDAPNEDWLTQYRNFMPTGMPHFVGLEAEATSISAYHPTVVYGLLQTEAYAKALFEVQRPVEDTTAEFIQRNVELRMERKRRVLARTDPVKLRVVLGEASLRIPVGDDNVMREQYGEIIRLAKEDHVSIQVLPFRRGYRSSNDFTILDLGSCPPECRLTTRGVPFRPRTHDVRSIGSPVGSTRWWAWPSVSKPPSIFWKN